MPTIKIKRSTSSGAAPASLVSGELAINEADEKLFYRKSNGDVKSVSLTAPASTATNVAVTPAGSIAATNVQAALAELDGDIQGKFSAASVSSFGSNLVGSADAAGARSTLGLGTAANQASTAFAATSHSHEISAVTGLQTALDAKIETSQASAFGLSLLDDANAAAARTTLGLGTAATSSSGSFAAASHVHTIPDVSELQTALDSKAAASHNHDDRYYTEAEVDALLADATLPAHNHDDRYYTESEVDTLLAGKAASSHTHAISDTTGLQTALEDKASASHTHTASSITDFSEAVDDRVGALLVAGSNVTLTYNDAGNTLTIASSGGGGGGASTLDDLTDVTLTTPSTGDLVRFNGTAWVNYADSAYAAASHTHTFASLTSIPTTLSGYGITDAIAKTDTAQSFTAKQTLAGDGGSNAPLSISATGMPSTLVNGDIWFASNRLRYRQASTTYEVPRFDTINSWTASNSFSSISVTGGSITGITDLAIGDGGTGASTAADARTNLELGTLATQSGTFSGTSSGTNTGDQTITLTGDVTGSGTGSFAATVGTGAITTAKLAAGAATLAKLDTTGASGKVLTAAGAGSAPTWSDPASGGGMTLLGTLTTTSGSSQSLTGLNLTSYDQLIIVFQGVNSGGANVNYLVGQSTADDVQVTGNSTGGSRGWVVIDLFAGTFYGFLNAAGISSSATSNTYIGDLAVTTASTSVSVAPSSGSFSSGTIRIYGVS